MLLRRRCLAFRCTAFWNLDQWCAVVALAFCVGVRLQDSRPDCGFRSRILREDWVTGFAGSRWINADSNGLVTYYRLVRRHQPLTIHFSEHDENAPVDGHTGIGRLIRGSAIGQISGVVERQ